MIIVVDRRSVISYLSFIETQTTLNQQRNEIIKMMTIAQTVKSNIDSKSEPLSHLGKTSTSFERTGFMQGDFFFKDGTAIELSYDNGSPVLLAFN